MASRKPKGTDIHEKVRKNKEDTWKADELTKELRKAREVDKKKRVTEKSQEQLVRPKDKSLLKEVSRTRVKDTEIKRKQDERNGEIKKKSEERPSKGGRINADKSKERILKESQSPRSSHSPQLKHSNTGSPFDKRKERVKRLDTEEKTSSPLGVRKSDQKLLKDGHDKKKLMGSPLHTRKDKDILLGKGENSPRGDRRTDRDKKKRKGEQEKITKGHSSNEPLKPIKTSHQKETEIEEELEEATVVPMEEVIEEIGQQVEEIMEYEYSDDQFEEVYEEDFDDIESLSADESEKDKQCPSPLSATDLNNIMQAIDSENQSVDQLESTEHLIEPSAPSSHSFLSPRPKISFTSPSSNQSVHLSKTGRKMRARAEELSNLITVDVLAVNLFELNPQSEYDFYMRNFGTSNTHQTSTQTGYDHEESDTQTDEVNVKEMWTQCPPYGLKEYGGSNIDGTDMFEDEYFFQYNSENLLQFIERAGKVVNDLLDEEEHYSLDHEQNLSNQYDDAFCSLKTSFGSRGHISCIDWRIDNPDMCLLGYEEDNTRDLGCWRSNLELWNTLKPSNPQFSLGNHSFAMSCCLLFPLVVSGNEDGSLVLWDLREPLSMHSSMDNKILNENRLYRVPTFTTAGLGWDSGHCEPVTCLNSTSKGTSNEIDWQEITVKGLSSQLLSMDSSGKICVWVVVEVTIPDPAGSDTDLGLVPGGKIKLIANSSFRIFDPSLISPSITFVCIKDINSNSLLIGTDNGNVICHVRYKASSSPRLYGLKSLTVNRNVSSISIHPTSKHHFLVGYSTGDVALYHSNKSEPLIQWPSTATPVHSLHWHPELPSVFIGIWQHIEIHIWDLLQSDTEPVHIINCNKKSLSALPVSTANSKSSGMIVCSEYGSVEMYHFKTAKFSHNNCKEMIEDYFTTLF